MGKLESSLREFVMEAEEIIEDINQKLVEIDSVEDRAGIQPNVVNAIFRGAHSLKGMSGMVGLNKVSDISHRLEDILDKIRMGKMGFTDRIMVVLFKGFEMVQALVRLLAQGKGEETDVAPLLEEIDQVIQGGEEQGGTMDLESFGIDPELIKVLTEYESHRLKENIGAGLHLYEIIANFKLDTFDKDLAKLNTKIQKLGEIITTLPNSTMSQQDGIAFNIILGTKSTKKGLIGVLEGENSEVTEINYQASKEKTGGEAALSSEGSFPESTIRSVSHTIRVDIGKLDGLLNIVGEMVVVKTVVNGIAKGLTRDDNLRDVGLELQKVSQDLNRKLDNLQDGLIEIRMIPIGQVFDRLERIVRKVSKQLGKEVDLQISGEETKLDKSMIEDIADPLMHLIRNSLDHGIESKEARIIAGKPEIGLVCLRAMQKGNSVVIEVEDDGSGINSERVYQKGIETGVLEKNKEYDQQQILSALFTPGFSTKENVTELSGRGVGLDVVAKNITKLSGMVDIETKEGKGTKFIITLPITMVIVKALIVSVGSEKFAIPLNSVSESLLVDSKKIKTIEGKEVTQLRNQTLPIIRLKELFQIDGGLAETHLYIIVVGVAEKRLGLVVDAIEGQQEIVIKPLGEFLKNIPGVAGATELGDRRTILVLDVGSLIEEALVLPSTLASQA